MNDGRRSRLITLALLLSGCAAAGGSLGTLTDAGMIRGSAMSREACASVPAAAWVLIEEEGDCIRHYGAGLRAENPLVVVFLHGDVLAHRRDKFGYETGVSYIGPLPPPDPDRLLSAARREHDAIGLPYVFLARPGVYGSSGDHKKRRRPREVQLVNAALDDLRSRYRIGRFALAGQSGGGHLVGALLAMRRDIECAVMTSAGVAVRKRILAKGWPPGQDTTGYRDFVDPIDQVERIQKDPGRRIFVIGDERDTNVPFETQKAYYDALKARGLEAYLAVASASGPQFHSLGATAHRAVSWCARGLSAEEIVERARQGERRYD